MGVYTIEQIKKDFNTVTKGVVASDIQLVELVAIKIIDDSPDNEARDMALSHLLQAAEMLSVAHIFERNKA